MTLRTKIALANVRRFKKMKNAVNYHWKTEKPSLILLGDNDEYWVTTLGDAGRLNRLGYELLPEELRKG